MAKQSKVLIPGNRFGILTLLAKGTKPNGRTYRYIFQCDCGKVIESYPQTPVGRGHCGCLCPTLEERLVGFLLLNDSTRCWEWQGWKNNKGYGAIGVGGYRLAYVHRVAWELWKGPIPESMCVLHRCDNPVCCNPDHLFLGTIADNNADCRAKGRHVSGFVIHRHRGT